MRAPLWLLEGFVLNCVFLKILFLCFRLPGVLSWLRQAAAAVSPALFGGFLLLF